MKRLEICFVVFQYLFSNFYKPTDGGAGEEAGGRREGALGGGFYWSGGTELRFQGPAFMARRYSK
jgi:hypothetical protein